MTRIISPFFIILFFLTLLFFPLQTFSQGADEMIRKQDQIIRQQQDELEEDKREKEEKQMRSTSREADLKNEVTVKKNVRQSQKTSKKYSRSEN